MAAQVAPPMMEREIITMIVDTLLVFYYDKMVGYMPSSLTDLVFTGERIEVGYTTGNDACSRLAQNGESDLPQWRHLWWQLQLH